MNLKKLIFLLFTLCALESFANADDEIEIIDEASGAKKATVQSVKPAIEKKNESNKDVIYPKISSFEGQVSILGRENGKVKIAKNEELKERADIKTQAASKVIIKIDSYRSLEVFENSWVVLPSISWDSGEAPIIQLKSGKFRWRSFAVQSSYPVMIDSDLVQFILPEADLIFDYDKSKVTIEALVVEGEMYFSAMNAEDSVMLSKGEKASFKGVMEGKDVAYDILLKGKKIPRGKLSKAEKFDAQAYLASEKKILEDVERKKQAALKKIKDAEILDATRDEVNICIKPRGKLNECVLICENNPKSDKKCRLDLPKIECVQYLCNAGGDWADRKVMKRSLAHLCQSKPTKTSCLE